MSVSVVASLGPPFRIWAHTSSRSCAGNCLTTGPSATGPAIAHQDPLSRRRASAARSTMRRAGHPSEPPGDGCSTTATPDALSRRRISGSGLSQTPPANSRLVILSACVTARPNENNGKSRELCYPPASFQSEEKAACQAGMQLRSHDPTARFFTAHCCLHSLTLGN